MQCQFISPPFYQCLLSPLTQIMRKRLQGKRKEKKGEGKMKKIAEESKERKEENKSPRSMSLYPSAPPVLWAAMHPPLYPLGDLPCHLPITANTLAVSQHISAVIQRYLSSYGPRSLAQRNYGWVTCICITVALYEAVC